MGNCQAAEAATVVIHHPKGNRVERIYWSVSARQVMASHPGHYVALVLSSPAARSENGTPVKQLKLLRPDDTLLLGQVYHLISFEEVLKEFAAKKCVKLGKLLKERGVLLGLEKRKDAVVPTQTSLKPKPENHTTGTAVKVNFLVVQGYFCQTDAVGASAMSFESAGQQAHRVKNSSSGSGSRGAGRHHGGGGGGGGGQWKPALQSIAEFEGIWKMAAFGIHVEEIVAEVEGREKGLLDEFGVHGFVVSQVKSLDEGAENARGLFDLCSRGE
ncbi:hypothetical protein RJ639_021490 [Escallonia herrerae]|uniref:DUF4228 domain-containing protein n=1 Tax=Escallonia herrerae TaxID=1293975 RepID=A0AA89AG85_9ASTE|nr:hypothetical protein RJ639_021490 [Escallonia herrerae]